MGVLGVVWKWVVKPLLGSLGNGNVLTLSCSWLLSWPKILCGVQLPKAPAALTRGTVNYLGCGVGGTKL